MVRGESPRRQGGAASVTAFSFLGSSTAGHETPPDLQDRGAREAPVLSQTLLEEHAPASPLGPHGIVVCPGCQQPLVARAARAGVNRGTVTRTALRIRVMSHARAVHNGLSARERSLLADRAVEGMRP